MTLLNSNSRGAERQRGCLFSETFRTQARVEENMGTVAGTPTFDPNTGVTLNGTTDYIAYALQGSEFISSNLSILLFFAPDFATSADANYGIFDSSGVDYGCWKRNNASSNVLRVTLGGTNIADIPEATYSPHWLVGQRNVLLISGTSGDTSAWLNGGLILDADATAWTPTAVTTITVGSNNAHTIYFDGSISRFCIFSQLLTAAEALDYYNETTWTWRPRALVELPMLNANVSGTSTTNVGTLGSAADAVYGDGSTGSTFPTKETWRRGYLFDAVTNGFTIPDQAALRFEAADADFSIVTFMAPEPVSSFRTICDKVDGTNDGWAIYNASPSSIVRFHMNDVDAVAVTPLQAYSPVSIMSVADRTNSTSMIYLNGRLDDSAFIGSVGTMPTTVDIIVGNRQDLTRATLGSMLTFFIFPFALTQLQVNDLHRTMMREINQE